MALSAGAGLTDRPPQRSAPIPPAATPAWQDLRESDADHAACLLSLRILGATFRETDPIRDDTDPDCGIAQPVQISHILPGLRLTGDPVMRCDTARALGFWARDFLRPAAATLPGAPRLTEIQTGAGYDCRARVGTGQDRPRLSQHALGNAIDVMGFGFDSGDHWPIIPRQDSGDLAEAYQAAARASACLFFTTVLGPGANDAHDDHLHLDVIARNRGWRICQ
ncbi:extensin family protein [Paracoccus sp. (in: a-proteobacteria)]|uniref:extensin-like domain-containing protein n=1 Tax=Paracoccus sp. TaxID=267 RepID=UPI0026DEE886|nr:extensin family protein [Paracoccus sp. (in: a-proteobacteria)]MDO5648318.1 extensin family protein [Paracoccus sp. (in: a-proteobacteria)]